MTASEKRLVILFCTALGCFLGYYIVSGVFIGPAEQARKDLADYTNKRNVVQSLKQSEMNFAERWRKFASRTFSYDKNQAFDWFGESLKDTAAANGFSTPDIKKKTSTTKLGRKTGIEVISYEINVKDEYTKALKLLRAMYDADYVSLVTDVTITPESREGRDMVKLKFTVGTLVLPEVSSKNTKYFAGIKTMPRDPAEPLDKWRDDFPPESAFALFGARNIFREYMPPPSNSVIVDNHDLKLVGIGAKYYWDGEVQTESQIGVQPGKQETIVGKGDEVEIVGVYADGTEFRQRHAFRDGKAWSYKVPTHTIIEPRIINLAIDSRDADEARVTLTIVNEDGTRKTLLPMVMAPESKQSLGEFEAKEIIVAAVYDTGRDVPPKTFRPGTSEQVYLVPKKPVDPPDTQPEVVVAKPDDIEPATGYTVTGLLTYHDSYENRDRQEMIVNGPDGRRIFVAGKMDHQIDGGVLIAVCPLGGIVYMPESGNYYLYPRGQGFEMRAKLNADKPEQLAMAIQEWSKQN